LGFTSACPIGQNAETKFSSSLFEFLGGARNPKIGEENFAWGVAAALRQREGVRQSQKFLLK